MHAIHDVAAQFHVTYDALRFYEKKGLLHPIQRNDNGQREYSDHDLDDLNKLLHLRHLGATVAETKQMLDLFRDDHKSVTAYDTGIALLEHLQDETNQQITRLQQQQSFLVEKMHRFEQEKAKLLSADTPFSQTTNHA
ncbi:helix-turn-helix domain-containing protein [Furfurilactobacillus entadae]|uniref:helix-turn-helix domain-containing protein n=1 Tax=Furfurilactobacillus entadae TaxID=2922307 RepID=UPI0035E524B3